MDIDERTKHIREMMLEYERIDLYRSLIDQLFKPDLGIIEGEFNVITEEDCNGRPEIQ